MKESIVQNVALQNQSSSFLCSHLQVRVVLNARVESAQPAKSLRIEASFTPLESKKVVSDRYFSHFGYVQKHGEVLRSTVRNTQKGGNNAAL